MRLVISLATRGRPAQLLDTIRRSTANLTLPNTLMMVQVDQDDLPTINALNAAELDRRVTVNIMPREDTIAGKWNRAYREEIADVYLVAADDDPYVVPGYDAALLHAAQRFPDGIGMVYGHMANASFSGVMAPTRRFCDFIGGIFPEYFPYWFCDHWTDDVAKLIGRISFADVKTDQSHAGKTQELREVGWWATWFDAAYLLRREQARRIIDSPQFCESPERKEILRTHHPLIEYRSRWINNQVRREANILNKWSGLKNDDPRYLRVKQRAVAMLPLLLAGMESDEADAFRAVLDPPRQVVGLQRAFA